MFMKCVKRINKIWLEKLANLVKYKCGSLTVRYHLASETSEAEHKKLKQFSPKPLARSSSPKSKSQKWGSTECARSRGTSEIYSKNEHNKSNMSSSSNNKDRISFLNKLINSKSQPLSNQKCRERPNNKRLNICEHSKSINTSIWSIH